MQISLLESQKKITTSLIKEVEKAAKQGQGFNHTLILGDVGAGKTTVLRAIFDELSANKEIKNKFTISYLPLIFNIDNIDKLIENTLVGSNFNLSDKNHIVIIDDLHLLIGSSEEEAHELRKILLRKTPNISVIASARSSFKNNLTHSKAFYGFFRQVELGSLNEGEIASIMLDLLKTRRWIKLNDNFGAANPFWFYTITDLNLRLVLSLRNIALSKNTSLDPKDILEQYFEMVGPIFLSQMMELPKQSRAVLDGASLCAKEFKMKEVGLADINLSQEATKLVARDLLIRTDKGFSFKSSALKAWLRYVKNIPYARVVNTDFVAGSLFLHSQTFR